MLPTTDHAHSPSHIGVQLQFTGFTKYSAINLIFLYSLQCPFMDVCLDQISEEQLVSDALHQLVQSIHHRAGFLNIYQSVIECVEPDIR